jgi:hypothetical protein
MINQMIMWHKPLVDFTKSLLNYKMGMKMHQIS